MRRKIIIRVSGDRLDALAWLKIIYGLTHDDEVYDLAFDQLYEATRKLEARVKEDKSNEASS